jgi:hypothetical protein
MRFLLFLLLLLVSTPSEASEPELHIGKFSSGDLSGWKEQTIFGSGKSTYGFVQDNGRSVLQGKSKDSASGLLYKVDLDPRQYPVITWSWKIDHTVRKGNERTKDGHDFAARLYVVFPRGFFSSHRAIEYVWGNVLPRGEMQRSPYSKNAVMIAVDSGNEFSGHWTFHRRNFYDDYRTAFGEEPPRVGAIAIMTDSDNTHESAVGYYGNISIIQAAPKSEENKAKDQKPKEPAARDVPQKDQKPKNPAPKEPSPLELKQKEETAPNGSSPPLPAPPLPPLPDKGK